LAQAWPAGAAVITRPALLVAAAVIPFAAHRGESARQRFGIASTGLALMLSILMVIQNHLFGSPFSTGYGSGAALFSWSHARNQPSASSRVTVGKCSVRCSSRG
jgi:hypothetical protein